MPTWYDLDTMRWRIGIFTAAGWSVGKIALTLGLEMGEEFTETRVLKTRRRAVEKLGLGGTIGFALCATAHLAPHQREQWRQQAERYRTRLRKSEAFDPVTARLAMLLADPLHCDETHVELGRMVSPTPISKTRVTMRLQGLWTQLGEHTSRAKLAVVLHLAPFALEEVTASKEVA